MKQLFGGERTPGNPDRMQFCYRLAATLVNALIP
jgi:hypothetical protein